MCVIDQAQKFEALNLAQAIQVHQEKVKNAKATQPQGECINPICSEPFPEGSQKLYCDAKCADKHAQLLAGRSVRPARNQYGI